MADRRAARPRKPLRVLIVVGGLLLAVNVWIIAGVSQRTNKEPLLPTAIEELIPKPGDLVSPQSTIGVNLSNTPDGRARVRRRGDPARSARRAADRRASSRSRPGPARTSPSSPGITHAHGPLLAPNIDARTGFERVLLDVQGRRLALPRSVRRARRGRRRAAARGRLRRGHARRGSRPWRASNPGLSPATTKLVFFDTLPVTFAPRASSAAVASSRVHRSETAGEHDAQTRERHAAHVDGLGDRGREVHPAARSFSITSRLRSSAKNRCTLSAMI